MTGPVRIKSTQPIDTPTPMPAQDPFLFAVYHKDEYPAGDAKMQAPRRGNGADFDSSAKYRMYHGDRFPGFPQHPHRGFETITCTIEGTIDHTDSLGCGGRYGSGDVQWMTAGKGIVHGENFPLLNQSGPNVNRFFQLWINLPAKSKMVEPNQLMHWAETVPRYTSPDAKTRATMWCGSLYGTSALPATKDSWAIDPANDVNIWHITLTPTAKFSLPRAAQGSNRSLYFIEGPSLTINEDRKLISKSVVTFENAWDGETLLENPSTDTAVEVLILQGKPIGEPVAQHGPFVMNTREEIVQAFTDYRRTQFGGWPWPEDAMIFPRTKGRFLQLKGVPEQQPPSGAKKDDNGDASTAEKGNEL
ncbi:hypothetical protein HK100_008964 [Physocladia obscura]|uniref:Pirin n=1 Tax=Physocladia obscura TaxID=109957 RepID=A0AAD5SN08_9FUNG|nr:hypothetical protein HK100_008964 [Physocladia obscura]